MRALFIVIALLVSGGSAHARLLETETAQMDEQRGSSGWSWSSLVSKAKSKLQALVVAVSGQSPRSTVSESIPEPALEKSAPPVAVQGGRSIAAVVVDGKSGDQGKLDSESVLMNFKDKPVVRVERPGRPADPKLESSKAGVPTFSLFESSKVPVRPKVGTTVKPPVQDRMVLVKVDDIPELDIGEEPRLKAAEWTLPELDLPVPKTFPEVVLDTPVLMAKSEFIPYMQDNVEAPQPIEKIPFRVLGEDEYITVERVKNVQYAVASEPTIKVYDVQFFTEEDLFALRTMIVTDKRDSCHSAMGLLHKLSNSERVEYRSFANFNLAQCLHKSGLFTESVERLLLVVKDQKREYASKAITQLLADLPFEFEVYSYPQLSKLPDTKVVPGELLDRLNLGLSRAASRLGDFKASERYGRLIAESSPHYAHGQYLISVAEYTQGKLQASMDRQRLLVDRLKENKTDNALLAFVTLNFARTAFLKKDYDQAILQFKEIRRDNPLWLQALTEQGWAQLMVKDNAGAIGNMYSVHAPFFSNVYKPESYVVRTIGYLNICQYGDAYRTLTQLEKIYRPMLLSFDRLKREDYDGGKLYGLVVQALKDQKQTVIETVPTSILKEAARHRDFLNHQNAINNRVDELGRYTMNTDRLKKDRTNSLWFKQQSLKRAKDFEKKIASVNRIPNGSQFLEDWKNSKAIEQDAAEYYEFEASIASESMTHFEELKTLARPRVEALAAELKQKAGQVLHYRVARMHQDLLQILDNNELLRYEVFSGSGENLRFQMAGGTPGENRIPASVRPQNRDLQWNFDGEYWQDEIGHYRSSLKNNCPEENGARRTDRAAAVEQPVGETN